MHESPVTLAALKRHIATIERHHKAVATTGFVLGEALNLQLGRGLLHEIIAAEPEDGASAAGFALMLALRAAPPAMPILWLSQEARLHAPGLAELGVDPARLILVMAPDGAALLKAAADGLRCAGLGAVVIEARKLDLTISRRLALAAERSGVTALLLRPPADQGASVAWTRWRVASAVSTPLAADAPGGTAIDLDLLRYRAGRSGLRWRLEWNRDQQAFTAAPPPGALLPLAARRSADPGDAAVAA